VLAGVLFAPMAGAVAFQTQLAQRQLELDRLELETRLQADEYERLRREQAELRSPGRLADEATALGMVPGEETEFMVIEPSVIAEVQLHVGQLSEESLFDSETLVEERAEVKGAVGTAP
jgi:cell division protein FtsL